MKKKILYLISISSILFSSAITAFASNAGPEDYSFSLKDMFSCFINSSAAVTAAVIFAVVLVAFLVFRKKLTAKLSGASASAMVNAFIAFFSVSGIACLAMAFLTDGETWSNLMHVNLQSEAIKTQFEDYILSVKSAGTQQFYKTAETNTPFAHLIFFILAQFLPPKYIYADSFVMDIMTLRNQTFMYLYLIVVMFVVVILYRMNRSVLRNNKLNMRDEVVAFLLVVSFPAFYCIEKGNISAFSLLLTMLFIIMKGSEKKLFRELALLAVSASAAISPYTLIFALLIITDINKKTIIDFARTVVYFLIMFITPAIFTGFGNLKTYVVHFISVDAESYIAGNMSISNLLHFFGIENKIVIYAVVILTFAIAVTAMLRLPEMWQKTAAGAYIILNIFAYSDAVAAMFVFIPLVFLLSQNEHKAINWAYMLSFALLVTPFPEWYLGDSTDFSSFMNSIGIANIRNANNLISLAAAQMLLILLAYQTVKLMKENKLKKTEAVKTE